MKALVAKGNRSLSADTYQTDEYQKIIAKLIFNIETIESGLTQGESSELDVRTAFYIGIGHLKTKLQVQYLWIMARCGNLVKRVPGKMFKASFHISIDFE
jgi:hypothetical protein